MPKIPRLVLRSMCHATCNNYSRKAWLLDRNTRRVLDAGARSRGRDIACALGAGITLQVEVGPRAVPHELSTLNDVPSNPMAMTAWYDCAKHAHDIPHWRVAPF
ncbi:hypothetical protein H257_14183 [Aphanomyces astaci]|uniref:Uncharacterized protein n=1 Tax=Aphanomyces astaci TaxID=112090 RepID=W4FS24_APHAT|nr:hypothetical protein H257_14183 [Aphanomyces astaci]ETV70277.1 hypothetical protein H257_14183 [Aphanomyces astaci]|eukprot:XP_009840236.1 hypothetical protein H257_14183 [Aphanomyces astaci]